MGAHKSDREWQCRAVRKVKRMNARQAEIQGQRVSNGPEAGNDDDDDDDLGFRAPQQSLLYGTHFWKQ